MATSIARPPPRRHPVDVDQENAPPEPESEFWPEKPRLLLNPPTLEPQAQATIAGAGATEAIEATSAAAREDEKDEEKDHEQGPEEALSELFAQPTAAGSESDPGPPLPPPRAAPVVQRNDGGGVAIVEDFEATPMRRSTQNTRALEHEAMRLQKAKMKRVALVDDGACKSRPLTEVERRQIMHLLDLSEHERTKTGADKVPKGHKLTHERIAELTNRHVNTISKLKRERDRQQCLRVAASDGRIQTVEMPQPKQVGGYRGSRLTEEQQRMCTRIAIERPRLTSARIRERLQELYPELNTLSDTTVWRMLDRSGLHFLRAKLRDPRADGTTAHMAEKEAFLNELRKGESGELGAHNLFFMDETTLYLNETARRAWGTSEHPAEIKHAKGKTVTIGVYAGLGLVSPLDVKSDEWRRAGDDDGGKPVAPTDPRGNDFEIVNGEWKRTDRPPAFMLFWWLRPPTRKNLVLSRFLTVQDVLDPNMVFSNPIPEGKPHFDRGGGDSVLPTRYRFYKVVKAKDKACLGRTSSARLSDYVRANPPNRDFRSAAAAGTGAQRAFFDYAIPMDVVGEFEASYTVVVTTAETSERACFVFERLDDNEAAEFSFVGPDGKLIEDNVNAFLDIRFDRIRDPSELAEALWLNNIEWRQVDDAGELVNVMTANRQKVKVLTHPDAMFRYLDGLKSIVARAMLVSGPTDRDENYKDVYGSHLKPDVDDKIPRCFYVDNGRSYLGGRIDSERGDRALFLEYLRKHVVYIERAFSSNVRKNLNYAWDSAPQHGKTDVTKNTKSFIHRWVETHLNVRGAIFLPVREPDFNPVELLFAFIKGVVRRKFPSERGEVDVDTMIRLIDEAFMEVTETMVKGWLRYGCYLIPDDSPQNIKAIERTERCGYDRVVDVQAVWDRILKVWEEREYGGDGGREPSDKRVRYATIRSQLIDDASALQRFVSRFHTIGDALRYTTPDGVSARAVKVGHDGKTYDVMGSENAMAQIIRPDAHVELWFDDSVRNPTLTLHNLRKPSHRELLKIVHLKTNDKTGLLTILHHWAQYTLSDDLVAALNSMTKIVTARDGVLANLTIAARKARDLARRLRQNSHVFVPKSTTDVELLLDVQERLFHPKLDTNERVTMTIEPKPTTPESSRHEQVKLKVRVDFETNVRTRVNGATLESASRLDTDTSRVRSRVKTITSTVATFEYDKNGNQSVLTAGNPRMCDLDLRTAFVDDDVRLMRREVMQTPYAKSLPSSSEIGSGNAMACAVGVISIKACDDETERVQRAVSAFVRERVLPHVNLDASPSAEAQRQITEATKHVLETVDRRSRSANDQAKLYNVFDLRAERRANVQLRQLARGDPDERRWPGYPLSERHERDGRRIRTVTEDGEKDDGDENDANRMDDFNVKPIRSIKFLNDTTVVVRFEGDDETREMKTEDADYKMMVDKKFSTQNYAMSLLAKRRFDEMNAKDQKKSRLKGEIVVGIYEGVRLKIDEPWGEAAKDDDDDTKDTKHTFIGAKDGNFILFDPTNATFYPAPHKRLSDYSRLTQWPAIGLWDPKVTAREKMAEYWSAEHGDGAIKDISDIGAQTDLGALAKPRLTILKQNRNGDGATVYHPAFKRVTIVKSDMKKVNDAKIMPIVRPYNIGTAFPSMRVYKLGGEKRGSVYQVRMPMPAQAPVAAEPKLTIEQHNRTTSVSQREIDRGYVFWTQDAQDERNNTISYIMPRPALDRMYRDKSLVEIENACLSESCECVVAKGETAIDGTRLSFVA